MIVVTFILLFHSIPLVIYFQGDVNNEINKTPSAQIVINSNQNKSKCIDKTETRTKDETVQSSSGISVTGYLSVFANGVDNFTHGLAIAASFSAGFKVN